MPSLRIIIILALLASAAAVAGSVRPLAGLTASALPVSDLSATLTYTDEVYGFSFEYPQELSLLIANDRSAGRVIFGDLADGTTVLLGVTSPYDAGEELTRDLLRSNLDERGIASEISEFPLSAGIIAFLFGRSDAPMGPTRDALFVRNGKLYQVSVTGELEDALNDILDSWRFNN